MTILKIKKTKGTTERRRNYLVLEPNYHNAKFFTESLLANQMKKTEILMNKPVILQLSRLELTKMLMYEFWYDYIKPKYGKKAKLCYMDIDIKTDDTYKDIAEDVETRFATSNYKLECTSIDRPLPKGRSKKVIGLMKDELCRKAITKFVGPRVKTYSYLIDDGSKDKKVKRIKKCVIKRKLKFENYRNCLEATQPENKINDLEKNQLDIDSIKGFIKNNKSILKIQQRFKGERHNFFTEEINKIALSSNDD